MAGADLITYVDEALTRKTEKAEVILKDVKRLQAEYIEFISKKRKELANDPRVTRNINFNPTPEAAAPTATPPTPRHVAPPAACPTTPPAVQLRNPPYTNSSGHRFMATPS
jgi:hypothetical protein